MSVEELFLALSDIQQKKIEAAYMYDLSRKSLHKRHFRLVACIILFVTFCGAVVYGNLFSDNTIPTEKTSTHNEEVQSKESNQSAIAEEYQSVIYNGIEYAYTGNIVNSTVIGQYLAESTAYSISEGDVLNEKDCKIYSVVNANPTELIAVKLNGIYYLYTRSGEINESTQ